MYKSDVITIQNKNKTFSVLNKSISLHIGRNIFVKTLTTIITLVQNWKTENSPTVITFYIKSKSTNILNLSLIIKTQPKLELL